MATKRVGKNLTERAEEALALLREHGYHGRIFPCLTGRTIRLTNGDYVNGNLTGARWYLAEHAEARTEETK